MKNTKNADELNTKATAFNKAMRRILLKYEIIDKDHPEFEVYANNFRFKARGCPKKCKPIYGENADGEIVVIDCDCPS